MGEKTLEVYDITIIGAGPTGLFAAFYAAGMRGMKTKVLEALDVYGGQLTVLYPDKFIYDVAGFPKVLSKDLARQLYEQASAYKPEILFSEKVINLSRIDGGIIELTTDKGVHFSKTVLIAAGHGAFTPRKLGNPSVEMFENKGVYYFVKDKWEFKGKRIVIVGGGDSAVDWALNLKDIARETYLVHRRTEFRAHEGSVIELFHSPVKVLVPYEVKEARGNNRLEAVKVFNNKTGEEQEIECDAMILQLGHVVDVSLFKKWGLEMDGNAIKINGRCETNIPGVYAAGDIASQTDSVKLALLVTGFAQAAIAVNVAKNYIDPKSSYFPGHSSERRM
ncbi:MAG: NAD(P)/FAD-dependent oxidoreductase [Candidatus Caldarchaeum sp.]|nr:NAD(P)/FAD-dependent oxidoreductase [Candidatus Caldarchaeum sp.]MDW7978044.1 NAD(P)/FAD-dependent oxidoreductase [Candidatus Caldarchaeum sp.]MDW8360336.1 NAD(P)/FAD-dependent oxidoreductase [Candidatus Caldarchaeum sp.]